MIIKVTMLHIPMFLIPEFNNQKGYISVLWLYMNAAIKRGIYFLEEEEEKNINPKKKPEMIHQPSVRKGKNSEAFKK